MACFQLSVVAAQLDNNRSAEMSAQAGLDSVAMKTLALVTAIFLPATFIATLFSMGMFDWQAESSSSVLSPEFWIFWVVSVPLSIAVLAAWWCFWDLSRTYYAERFKDAKPTKEHETLWKTLKAKMRRDSGSNVGNEAGRVGAVAMAHDAEDMNSRGSFDHLNKLVGRKPRQYVILNVSVDGSYDYNHSVMQNVEQTMNLFKLTYALEILFGIAITTVKFSILWFYWELFATSGGVTHNKRIIQVAAVACTIWFLVMNFLVIFQCIPIHAYWDKLAQPLYCMDTPKLLLAYELTNLFLDVFILCIPMPIVWQLNLKSSKKISLLGIFFLGAFVCVASILRLNAIWDPSGQVAYSNAMLWSTLQIGLAIICACLPTLAPILPSIIKLFSYIRSWSLSIWSRSPANNHKQAFHDYRRSDEYGITKTIHGGQYSPIGPFNSSSQIWAEWSHSRGYPSQQSLGESIPSMSIKVDRQVDVA
ncbi:hypothetical protein INS49_004785 [Diaporthe citri]|uniref:uncharacterized protein n=1 Tax=Diaporthe citri TaxID=83186 RepID=UPI001C7EBC3A|nr:uncharacterized protein INS49_004785 [Diaporthe citri]KAG6354181.1 hypothetical protein INS49_004785 [Diaporthe citri]